MQIRFDAGNKCYIVEDDTGNHGFVVTKQSPYWAALQEWESDLAKAIEEDEKRSRGDTR